MKNIKFEVLDESVKIQKHYAFIKISFGDKVGYCISVKDDELVCHSIGSDMKRAEEIYKLLLCGEVSALHVNDVLMDVIPVRHRIDIITDRIIRAVHISEDVLISN